MTTFAQILDQAGGAAMSQGFNEFLTTPTGQSMLSQIEARAKAGVTAAATDNAINLMVFALAGGTVGGAIFKGPIGFAAAAALSVWAGLRLLNAGQQPSAPVRGLYGLNGRIIGIREQCY